MPMNFPPSSPILGATSQDHFNDNDPFYQLSSDVGHNSGKSHKRRLTQLYEENHYPTPNASSSTGRSSSPIRANPGSSPVSINRVRKGLAIELDPRNCTRLAVGRKKSVCDIVLPSKKNISRQHAFITYLPSQNQVKLECNGVNGIIVVLPRQIECHLKRKTPSEGVYELDYDDVKSPCNNGKELVNHSGITSFVLLKGETVLMPFIKGTTIDFRQAEAYLSLKDDLEDDENTTETDDETFTVMHSESRFHSTPGTPTKKLIKVPQSPPTIQVGKIPCIEKPIVPPETHEDFDKRDIAEIPQLASQTTPLTSFMIATPSTPRKQEKHSNPTARIQSTPVPLLSSSKGKNTLDFLSSNISALKGKKYGEDSQHKRKQHKPCIEVKKTPERILTSLEERGISSKELQHVLANHLAFANIQQTPLYQLQQVNSKTSMLSREELRLLLKTESCIGVIYREGKDAAGKPLDEEYYYDLENDPDAERKNLVRSLKGGRSGLRSCRRTHKQYFWKKPTN